MIRLKKQIKTSIASLALATGLLPRYVSGKLDGKAAVLMYHRVLPEQDRCESHSADGIIVSPVTFRRQMETLRRRFRPLSLEQYVAHLEEGRFPDNSCLVTFDDGWFDNHQHALPILQECGVPAVVFVATDYIGTNRCFWQESLSRSLAMAAARGEVASDLFAVLARPDVCRLAPANRKLAIRECIDGLKHRPMPEVSAISARVEAFLRAQEHPEAPAPVDRFMDWEQVASLQASGLVSIGSHCRSHVPLTKLSLDEASRELEESRRIIAEKTGIAPIAIAYPNGDCNEQIGAAAGRAGYRAAFSTARGYSPGATSRFLQQRINIHEHSTDSEGTFLARVALLT